MYCIVLYRLHCTFDSCNLFQVRVVVESLPNLVSRIVRQKIGPCAARITKHTKMAAILPPPSARCPRTTGSHFACNITDRAVRPSHQNLAPGGRTARWWTNPCAGRTGKRTRTYVAFGSPCVTPGETSIKLSS